MGRAAFLAAVGLFATTATAATSSRAAIPRPRRDGTQTNETAPITFANITPSPELKWVDCYDENLQCSYLTVPLDYQNPGAGTTDVAFIRYLVSEDAEDLLFNPGGPGGSGVEFAVNSGSAYAKKWGYNFISFDPRGVKWTGPRVSCSPSNTNATSKSSQTPQSLEEVWNEKLEQNKACSAANEHTNAKYVGTLAVVQDMMHFTELQAAARGKDPKKALINYYGVSYGTLLGQTLAAKYPDRLRRVLLDANVYGVAHYQGWEPSGIDDLAHGIWLFTKLCYEAGPKWCILAKDAGSIDEVHARFDAVLQKLKNEPVKQGDMTYDDNGFLGLVQQCMYSPSGETNNFVTIANATYAVWSGDLSIIGGASKLRKRETPADTDDVLGIITATDIAGRYPWKTYEQWKAAVERLQKTAPYGARNYASSNGLIGLAMDAFVPPRSQLFPGFTYINTSAPVLFVNTAGDPVTPMSSVHQMSRLFAGSSAFFQNSPGHGYASSYSKCSNDIVAAYFSSAKLPKFGTWCETDVEANFYFGGPKPGAE